MRKKHYILMAISLQGIAFAQAPIISYTTPQTFVMGTVIPALTPTNTGGAITYGKITILAGSGAQGSADGTGTAASFRSPVGVAVDASGNVYVADGGNHKIRKITPAGVVTTLAGSGTAGSADGTGTAASFNYPTGPTVDASGNLYVGDSANNKIRKITSAGVVTTLAGSGTKGSADGTGKAATFNYPSGPSVDASGNIYVADEGNNKIRKITSAGVVTTLAGSGTVGSADGTGAAASFYIPTGVAVDVSGNVFVADYNNNTIRMITPAGVVSTFAGSTTAGSADGIGTAASFANPFGLAMDALGNVYVGDQINNKIRKITPQGVVTTVAGTTTGTGTTVSFNYPKGVAVDASNYVYVADFNNNMIKKVDAAGGYIVTPPLPAGLSIDISTGIISGTPSAVSPQTTYTVTATNHDGTSTATVDITINAPLGLEDTVFKNMEIYPNPTKGEVNITNVSAEKVNVYNNAGQLVKTVANPQAANTTAVQLGNLPTGIYYLNIETENAHTVRQVIKQ